jgi:hypothetical protein
MDNENKMIELLQRIDCQLNHIHLVLDSIFGCALAGIGGETSIDISNNHDDAYRLILERQKRLNITNDVCPMFKENTETHQHHTESQKQQQTARQG